MIGELIIGDGVFMSRVSSALAAFFICFPVVSYTQSNPNRDKVIVGADVPLRIVVDERVSYAKPGTQIFGHLAEPVYVKDQVALPAGTKVVGHVTAVHAVAKQR